MNESNYVVLLDENGQPYIAHSVWSNARQKGAKYLEKIKDGAKTRYFYTQDELKAYYNKGKQKASQTVDKAKQKAKDAIGITARDKRDSANKALRAARDQDRAATQLFDSNYAKEKEAKAKRDEAQNAYNKAKSEQSKAEYHYNNAVKTRDAYSKQYDDYNKSRGFINKTMDKATAKLTGDKPIGEKIYDHFVEYNGKAADRHLDLNRANRNLESAKKKLDAAEKAYNEAYAKTAKDLDLYTLESDYGMDTKRWTSDTIRAYEKAEKEYAKTPLGMLDNLRTSARQAQNAIKNYGKEALKDLDSAFDSAKDATTKAANTAKEKVAEAVNTAKDKASDVADTTKDKATSTASKVKSAYDRMREEFAKRNQPPTPKLSPEGTETIIPEKIITENIIEEKRIPEERIEEKRIPEKRIEEKKVEEQRTAEEPWTSKEYQEALEYNSRKNNYFGTGETYPSSNEKTSNPRNDKIDASKVSTEYVYAVGSNTGHASDVNKVMKAEDAYNRAMRDYSRISAAKNASGQDKSAAKREMDELKREYDKLYNDLIDTLNDER